MSEPEGTTHGNAGSNRRALFLRLAGLVVLVVIIWWSLSSVVAWSDIVDAVTALTAAEWWLLSGVAVGRLALEPLLIMAVTPGLRWVRGTIAFLAPSATAAVIPGPSDIAVRYAMFRSWGYSDARTGSAVALVFLYTTFAKLALPVVAALLLLVLGRSDTRLVTVATVAGGVFIVGIVGLVLLFRSEALAHRVGHTVGTAAGRAARFFHVNTPESLAHDIAERAVHFRAHTGDVVRTRGHLAVGAAAVGQAALFVVLLVSMRVVGIDETELDWLAIFAAFAFVQLITSVPITPSGLGVAEAAYVTVLTAAASNGIAGQVAGAAIIYRLFSWIIVIPLGGLAWLAWRMGRRTSAANESPASRSD